MSGKCLLQFENLFNFTRKMATTIGTDIVREDFQFTWRTYMVLVSASTGVGFTAYTIYDAAVKGSLPALLISLAIIGAGVQGLVKLVEGTKAKNRKKVLFMHRTVRDIYIHYEGKSLEYTNELELSLSRVRKVLSIVFTVVFIAMSVVICVPIFMLVVKGERTFILNFYIPYIDVDTDFGYYFTSAAHFICVVLACTGNFIFDSWYFTYVAHIPLISNLIKCKFRNLDRILKEHPEDVKKSKPVLIDILKWHQKYNEFCQAIKEPFYWVIFTQIASECFSIISAIVCIFLDVWPAAPAYLMYAFALFYCFCFVGNIVQVANEDVIFYTYDSCWYLLTNQEQKMVLCLLRNAQQAKGILIGDVAPLSMSTALKMTKTFYTLSMLLREFLNN